MPEKAGEPGVSCPDCGTGNPAGAKFCKKCGTKLGAVEEVAPREKTSKSKAKPALFTPKAKGEESKPESKPAPQPKPEKKSKKPPKKETEAAGSEERESDLEKGKEAAREVGEGLAKRLKQAKSNPRVLLEPAKGRFNFLEILGVLVVCAMFGGLYVLGLLKFGPSMMLRSGAPFFLAYVIGLLVALKSFRGVLDRVFMKLFGWLGRFSPRARVLLGLALPVAYAFWDSEDRNMGFQSAGFTVTVATLLAHLLIRSTAFRRKSA